MKQNWSRPITFVCASLACLGLILPGSALQAAQPVRAPSPGNPLASDVELDPEGSLRGFAINVHGVPVAGAPVVVFNADREVARTSTDALGCFSVDGLRGGKYQVTIGRYARLVRTWAAGTAPPNTKRGAMIVVGDNVVRGQMCLKDFLCSDCVIITALVAAMIAVPIAVHNSDRKQPSSP